jgi:WD40 repeat protein
MLLKSKSRRNAKTVDPQTEPWLVSIDKSFVAKLWDLETGKEVRAFPAGLVAFSPDGNSIAFCEYRYRPENSRGPMTVTLVETITGKKLNEFDGGHIFRISRLAFSPDGRRLASGDGAGVVALWDIKTGKQNWTAFGTK